MSEETPENQSADQTDDWAAAMDEQGESSANSNEEPA